MKICTLYSAVTSVLDLTPVETYTKKKKASTVDLIQYVRFLHPCILVLLWPVEPYPKRHTTAPINHLGEGYNNKNAPSQSHSRGKTSECFRCGFPHSLVDFPHQTSGSGIFHPASSAAFALPSTSPGRCNTKNKGGFLLSSAQ